MFLIIISSRGLMKYVYEIMYDLSSLAVVNVRDLGNVKHAFKLLIFPDTRVFQCSSNSNKVNVHVCIFFYLLIINNYFLERMAR